MEKKVEGRFLDLSFDNQSQMVNRSPESGKKWAKSDLFKWFILSICTIIL